MLTLTMLIFRDRVLSSGNVLSYLAPSSGVGTFQSCVIIGNAQIDPMKNKPAYRNAFIHMFSASRLLLNHPAKISSFFAAKLKQKSPANPCVAIDMT